MKSNKKMHDSKRQHRLQRGEQQGQLHHHSRRQMSPVAESCNQPQVIVISSLTNEFPALKTTHLNLASSPETPLKIYKLEHLQRFVNLQSLLIPNNMISKIENLDALLHLRVLNLEFNHIRIVENLSQLLQLQELYLSYNCLETVAEELASNRKLKIVHIAYNDIPTLEQIRVLSQLPLLADLTVWGNPFIGELGYRGVVKMLLPRLSLLDQKSQDGQVEFHNQQDELCVLRKIMDDLVRENQCQLHPSKIHSHEHCQKSKDQQIRIQEFASRENHSSHLKNKESIAALIGYWRSKNHTKLQDKKQQIHKLTDLYASILSRQREQELQSEQSLELVTRKAQQKISQFDDRRPINSLLKTEFGHQNYSSSKRLMLTIKSKEGQYTELKLKRERLEQLSQEVDCLEDEDDIHLFLLTKILFGTEKHQNGHEKRLQKSVNNQFPQFTTKLQYKQLKQFLICEKPVSEIIRTMQFIIFGEQVANARVQQMHGYLKKKNKSLIGIIEELKDMKAELPDKKEVGGSLHQNSRKRNKINSRKLKSASSASKGFEQNRRSFIDQKTQFIAQFEAECKNLGKEWRKLEKEKKQVRHLMKYLKKEQIKNSKQKVHTNNSISYNFEDCLPNSIPDKKKDRPQQIQLEKYQQIEEDYKKIIAQLKKQKQALKTQTQELERKLQCVELSYERKYHQLEEFQEYFQNFKQDKQKIVEMKDQLAEIENQIQGKKTMLKDTDHRMQETSLREDILKEKVRLLEKKLVEKLDQLNQTESKSKENDVKLRNLSQELRSKEFELMKIKQWTGRNEQEADSLEKKVERSKNTLCLFEQKLRNLTELELSKKKSLKSLEIQITEQKTIFAGLCQQLSVTEEKLEVSNNKLAHQNSRINENKANLESLTDINRSITDMMQRQNTLKRAIRDLEMEKIQRENQRDRHQHKKLQAPNNSPMDRNKSKVMS